MGPFSRDYGTFVHINFMYMCVYIYMYNVGEPEHIHSTRMEEQSFIQEQGSAHTGRMGVVGPAIYHCSSYF